MSKLTIKNAAIQYPPTTQIEGMAVIARKKLLAQNKREGQQKEKG